MLWSVSSTEARGGAEPMQAGGLDRSKLSEPAQRLLALWEGKRRGDSLPAEADFNPAELTPWLSWLVLLDVEAGAVDFRYRRIGGLVLSTTGLDMSGKRLSEMPVPPDVLGRFMAEHQAAVDTRAPRYDVHRLVNPKRGEPVAFERLLLPLSEDGVKVTALLGMRRAIA